MNVLPLAPLQHETTTNTIPQPLSAAKQNTLIVLKSKYRFNASDQNRTGGRLCQFREQNQRSQRHWGSQKQTIALFRLKDLPHLGYLAEKAHNSDFPTSEKINLKSSEFKARHPSEDRSHQESHSTFSSSSVNP